MIIDIIENKPEAFNADEFTLTNDGDAKTDDAITVAVSGLEFTHDTIEQR